MSNDRVRTSRRGFLKAAGGFAFLAACDSNSGTSFDPSTAPKQYAGYAGLAQLPYFEMLDGRLRSIVDDMPGGIDIHGHLGLAIGTAQLDLTVPSERVEYLIDCDMHQPDCVYDLDVYINNIATDEMREGLTTRLLEGGSTGIGSIETHTVPNYIREMDDMRFDRAVLLPIAMNILQPDNMGERWKEAIAATNTGDRFVQFCSVHPNAEDYKQALRDKIAQGCRGVKYHPTMQFAAPNLPEAMEIFEICDELGVPVFFHAGKAGIELDAQAVHAEMSYYVEPIEAFPNTQFIFGHSGASEFHEALPIAKAHDNVWMGLAGPAISWLEQMIDEFDNDRILFGSDWPFYPLAATLARVFLATHGDKKLRDRIISDNARELLNLG